MKQVQVEALLIVARGTSQDSLLCPPCSTMAQAIPSP